MNIVSAKGQRISATKAFGQVTEIIGELPERWRAQFLIELAAFAPRLDARMKAGVPRRQGPRPSLYARSRPGAFRPAGGGATLLSTNLDKDSLTLKAGLLTPDARARGFYLFILDAGRGLKRGQSDARARHLYGKDADTLAGKFINAGGKRRRIGARLSVRYTRRISPISPGRYDITFGRVRIWARNEVGPVLGKVYDRAIRAMFWGRL